ncbi:hypothetical protein CGZ91_05850 [Parenemella sanctibonifatiensis]|uniref:Uncharacterized protein n=1 Tax=Parenemella sanctibonifatiensis TaxID=2016505 RepID=A0A255EJM1_9ACTN|nr:hypothetical protein CGZ92_09545 [Parenemella sanctibonifatiensis]OYN91430.1 hypothetical protein CGZ91_05850 [Parenemella sanctibonifatiensis]
MSKSGDQRTPRDYHHGRSPAAWAGTIPVTIAFLIGSIAFLLPGGVNWLLVGISAVIVVLSLIAAIVLRELGYGQK